MILILTFLECNDGPHYHMLRSKEVIHVAAALILSSLSEVYEGGSW